MKELHVGDQFVCAVNGTIEMLGLTECGNVKLLIHDTGEVMIRHPHFVRSFPRVNRKVGTGIMLAWSAIVIAAAVVLLTKGVI